MVHLKLLSLKHMSQYQGGNKFSSASLSAERGTTEEC